MDQEQGSSILSRWLQILNCAAVWSGGQLKFIPYGDAEIPAGNVVRTVQFAVPTPAQASSGVTPPPSITVCTPAEFAADGGVTYAFTGAPLSYIGSFAPSTAGAYGLSSQGTYLFAGGDESQVVSISYTYASPTSYVPNLTPIYDLTDLDFVDEKGNKDPLQAARLDPFSLPTIQRVEWLPGEVRLLERRVEALEEERRALLAELEPWMRRVRTLDQVLKGDTP